MQHDFTGETLAAELLKLLETGHNAAMRARLRAATDGLGEGGASKRAAQAILRVVREWKKDGYKSPEGATVKSPVRQRGDQTDG